MPRYSFSKLIKSQWEEQEIITAKGRRSAKKILADSNKGLNWKCGGTWRIRLTKD